MNVKLVDKDKLSMLLQSDINKGDRLKVLLFAHCNDCRKLIQQTGVRGECPYCGSNDLDNQLIDGKLMNYFFGFLTLHHPFTTKYRRCHVSSIAELIHYKSYKDITKYLVFTGGVGGSNENYN